MENDKDIDEFIENHIQYIRRMSNVPDAQLRIILKHTAMKDPSVVEKFKENRIKKQYNEITELAKNIKTEPKKLARRVDEGIHL